MTLSPLPAPSPAAELARSVALVYEVPRSRPAWELLDAEPMPESNPHHETIQLLELLLKAWASRRGGGALVGSNLAIRWDRENPRVGVDPDVYVVDPAPPEGALVESLRLWEPGHVAPLLAVEVVSPRHARKDYDESPDKYAASGTGELWVFDPELGGPESRGGPHRIQLWSRTESGLFARRYAGAGPVYSEAAGGFLVAVDGGRRLRLSDDAGGQRLWLTEAEAERAAKEAERAAKEAEPAAKEAALLRVAELEAELSRRRGLARSPAMRLLLATALALGGCRSAPGEAPSDAGPEASLAASSPPSAAPPSAAPSASAAPAAPLQLLRFSFTSEVRGKEPVDRLQSAEPGARVYAHLALRNRSGDARQVKLVFRVNDERRTMLTLKVEPSFSFRTWGFNTLKDSDAGGVLRLEVTDDGGKLLVDEKLPIKPRGAKKR